MKSKVLLILVSLAVTSIISAYEIKGSEDTRTNLKKPEYYKNFGGDFSLTGPEGKTVSLEDFRNKVVLIYFGYTFCPDVCPITLSNLKMLMLSLEEKAEDVQVIFISIDPERDTFQKLKDYVPYFHPTFIGLTGSEAELASVAKKYQTFYLKQKVESEAGYLMAHSDVVILVDQNGRFRGRYKSKYDLDKLTTDIRWLLEKGI
jgi:protein SCO1/2|tara:strand:- start:121 stop:729 length:609 start_codon:yes stop_codon:yes gene_type:complete